MPTRVFALALGIALIIFGFLGFLPAALTPPPAEAGQLRFTASEGYLFGLFHVNAAHSVLFVLLGAVGLPMFAKWSTARAYCEIVAAICAVLAILGLIPRLDTLFGLIPLYGHNVWLHAIVAVAAG